MGLRAAIAIVAVCASSCGGKGGGGGPPGDGVAGVVLEVDGQATARTAAAPAPRPLAVGSELAADDTVETAAGASLRLRLYHNRALLALEGGKSVALRDSAAWTAEPAAADPFDRGGSTVTTVAGRQAEGTGADTRATATPPVGIGVNATPLEPPVEPPPDMPKRVDPPRKPKDAPKSDPKLSPPTGGGGCDEVACLINPEQACCKVYRKGGGGGGGGNNTIAPDEGPLEQHQIMDAIRPVIPAMRACADKLPEQTKFSFKVAFKIDPSGSITSVELEPAHAGAWPSCVKAAARKARFPRAAAPTSFKLPLTLERH